VPGKNFSGFVAFIVSTSISGLPSKVVRKSEGIFFINKKSRKKGLKKNQVTRIRNIGRINQKKEYVP
tara:strand:- start:648 stop:848 length:201 start_codon:yes stop_codon:yes gene_type:complete